MKVAIITGAGSGIGLETAKIMHGMGMAVVGVGRSQDKLDNLVAALNNSDRVATISADVTAKEAPKQIVDFTLTKFGEINFVVNNAGIGSPKPLHETDDDTYDYFMDIMLRAPFRLCREAVVHMKDGDAFVNITSTYAEIGGRRGGAYSAAKGGLRSLTEHMACEYGPQGIRSNCVAPGVTMTDMVKDRMNDKAFVRTNVQTTPYPRLGSAEEVASTIAFLCSPGAGAINGQTVVVDCGWTKTKYLAPEVLAL
ncbi:SDR family oxidoreductase [Halioxenophilus sp. WMMB6]|uniref:SDR family NAD(P)-dependent oxidoreductase n=1 Tax=Halioxenophilus sp. WMMB6 TaxID=3073815 RepID=UPI00295EA5A2|nr:SDR family oxidoreductase [Halioxenophilus sp. WMMB6]